jgi:PAS domain S-box-containing protein
MMRFRLLLYFSSSKEQIVRDDCCLTPPCSSKLSRRSSVLILILLLLIASCNSDFFNKDQPLAKNGVLDLKSWDLARDGAINLDGEWMFYWNRLYEPGDFNKPDQPEGTGYIQLPRIWNGYQVDEFELTGHGFATYRLEIRLDHPGERLGLKVLDMATAYRLWINDQLIAENGLVAKDPHAMNPQFHPKFVVIDSPADKLVLTLQVSNFHHKKGGAWESILFGLESEVRKKRERELGFELLMFGCLLIIGFYHLGLYILKRNDPAPVFLAMVCFFTGLRTLLVGERFLIDLFPHFNWELHQKLEYVSFYLSITFFALFLRSLFSEFSNKILSLILWLGFLSSLFTFITPARFFSYGMIYFHYCMVGIAVFTFVIFRRIIINKREGASWIALGVFILLITVFVDILSVNHVIPNIIISPVGLFLFMLFQSLGLSQRLYTAFDDLEASSQKLTKTSLQKDALFEALKESEKKFRDLVENLDDVFFIIDLKGRIQYVSPAAKKIFSRDPEAMIGTPALDYIHSEDLSDSVEIFKKAVSGISNQIECRFMSSSEEICWTLLAIRPMINAQRVAGVQGIVSDITDHKRTQDLLLQTEKMVSIGGMVAGVAHELNNPLAGMLLANQTIIRRLSKDLRPNIETAKDCDVDLNKMQNYLEKRQIPSLMAGIKESGERAAEIIRNMLHFSRKSGSSKTAVDLNSILDKAIELAMTDYDLNTGFDIKSIKISREVAEGIPEITCVKTEIEQVMFNLVKNAAQAMFVAGTEKPNILLRMARENGLVRIEIKDNGPGMEDAVRRRVFEPFFTTKPEGEGTGLGLSVSYMIITKNHLGSMEVDSTVGRGTSFIIHIPCQPKAP